jgi:hypothetical protein
VKNDGAIIRRASKIKNSNKSTWMKNVISRRLASEGIGKVGGLMQLMLLMQLMQHAAQLLHQL